MALVNPYCSVAEVQTYLNNTDSTLQTTIETWINGASRFIDAYLGLDFLQHEFTALVPLVIYAASNAVFGDKLYLPYTPIITTTALTVKESGTTLTESTASVSGHFIRFNDYLLRIGQDWTVGNTLAEAIIITGKFGYVQAAATSVPTSLPANINRACVLIAGNLTGENKIDFVSPNGDVASVVKTNIPREALQLLGARRPML